MHLFLTSVLPFLAHHHASAAAFLTCRHHNFHASIIPEFLSDEERVKSFCETFQQSTLFAFKGKQYANFYNLFVQTPLMQFSPSFVICQDDCVGTILKSLLETKYFTRSLQRCSVGHDISLTNDILQCLSKVQSLTKLDLGWIISEKRILEIILNSFLSLETLNIENARGLDPTNPINILSPPPPALKALRSLTIKEIDASFVTQLVTQFSNLRNLELGAHDSYQELNLQPLSSSLPLLTELDLGHFTLNNTESLQNLVHLSSLQLHYCEVSDLSFLVQENSLPRLTTLCVEVCDGLSTSVSFAPLSHALNLHVLNLCSTHFNNDCLLYLQDMVHLRKLDLSFTKIVGFSRWLKSLLLNLVQLEELNLNGVRDIGNQGAIAGALYNTRSRLRVLNLCQCNLVDDDLNGIGALKNTLEDLDLGSNEELTNAALLCCNDLVKLKNLRLCRVGIDDLLPLKDCVNLEELNVSFCDGLTDDSFKVFSEEANSFPNLRVLNLSYCKHLPREVFEHLIKNNHLVYRLKSLNFVEMSDEIPLSSPAARNNLFQLKGLRRLDGVVRGGWDSELMTEVVQNLRNLEDIL